MSVPRWTAAGKLMHFPRLDGSGTTVPVYTIGWRIEDQPEDVWTSRFLKFKVGRKEIVVGIAAVLREAAREVIAVNGWDATKVGISTALSSGKTAADPKSALYVVGKWVATQSGTQWLPDAFQKDAHRSLHSLRGGAHERDAEVSGKYRCCNLTGIDHLIVLDDFVTRGSTLADMSRALHGNNPRIEMIGLALAKNERAAWAESCGYPIDNSHIPESWDRVFKEYRANVS